MSERITVVGGGVIGLAIAWEALRRGHAVSLVHEDRPGGASAAAGGMLAPVAEAEPALRPLVQLGVESLAVYPAWVQDLEAEAKTTCGLVTRGSLLVALHADHRAGLERIGADHAELGLESRWLDTRAVASLEARLTPRQCGALLVEAECAVDPRRLIAALRTAFERRGGRVVRDVSDATVTVTCTGAWTPSVRPVQGIALRLSGARVVERVVRTPDVYLVPRADGTTYVGATSEECGFDVSVRAGAVHELLEHAWRVVPGVAELTLDEVVVGLRPAAADHLPTIGWTGPGRMVAAGHFRNGILLAPITARVVVDAIAQGVVPDRYQAFDPRRFEGASR